MVRVEADPKQKPTDEQIKMLQAAANRPIQFDEDCPELTADELKEFKRISDEKRMKRRKQTVTLRLSPQALQKAKSLGKGYTSILSRILENALNDNEILKRNL